MDQEPQPTPTTDQPRKVLIIEDEYFIGELYIRALKKAGYDVVLAVDGKDGLEKALSDEFDVILLDIMVPTITGNDILDKLRQREPAIHGRVIITTNLEQSEETKKQLEEQADGYLIKAEITPKQLVGFVDNIR